MAGRRTLIRGAYVLSMEAIGELDRGSVLIEGDRIVAVERDPGALDGLDESEVS